jgi:hypothetical protein
MPTLAQYLMMNPSYGMAQENLKTGMSTAPVHSPLEGLARALQGGLGGYMQGRAYNQAKEQQAGDISALYDAVSKMGTNPNAMAELVKTHPMLAEDVKPFMMANIGLSRFDAMHPQGTPGSAPQVANAPAQGGGVNPNNIGNVRSPDGKGFAQPETFNDGVNLAVNTVKSYPARFNNGQPMNAFQIGERYAPRGDGANDPVQWAKNVAANGGFDPNMPLDMNNPTHAAAFARGVHAAEWGQQALHPPEDYAKALTGGGTQTAQTNPGADNGPPVVPFKEDPADAAQAKQLALSMGGTPDAWGKANAWLTEQTKNKTAAKQAAATDAWKEQHAAAREQQISQTRDVRSRAEAAQNVATPIYAQIPLVNTVKQIASLPTHDNHTDSQLLMNAVAVIAPKIGAVTSVDDLKKESGVGEKVREYANRLAGHGVLTAEERAGLVEAVDRAHTNAKMTANAVIKSHVAQAMAVPGSIARPEMFPAPFDVGQPGEPGQPVVTNVQPQPGPRTIQAGPAAPSAPQAPAQHGMRYIPGKGWTGQ